MYERIRKLCAEHGTNISRLERELGFANASLVKADSKMQAKRLYQIAQYFDVSMEYLLTGKDAKPENCNSKAEAKLDNDLLAHALMLAQLPEERKKALCRYIEVEYDLFKTNTSADNKNNIA